MNARIRFALAVAVLGLLMTGSHPGGAATVKTGSA